MAEKSSELEKITDTNIASGMDVEENTSLQTRSDEDALSDVRADDTEASDGEVTAETEQLREQIEETRRGMGETIDAIQERLSFSNISEQVKDQVSEQISGAVESAKDAFYGKAIDVINTVGKGFKEIGKTDLVKKAQQNPQVLAIVGIGIGALLVTTLISGGKKKKNASHGYKNYNSDDDEIRYTDKPRRELKTSKPTKSGESTLQSVKSKVGDTASSAYETVSGAASTAYAGVSSAAGSAYEGVGSAASKTYEGVGSVASKTYEGVGSVANKTYKGIGTAAGFAYDKAENLGGQVMKNYNHYIEENPLIVGAVALAVGAAVGFAIPLTKKENEYLGEYRDNIVEKAQSTAQDAIDTVKQMAGEAQNIIVEEVKTQTAS